MVHCRQSDHHNLHHPWRKRIGVCSAQNAEQVLHCHGHDRHRTEHGHRQACEKRRKTHCAWFWLLGSDHSCQSADAVRNGNHVKRTTEKPDCFN